jgi:sugar phosphate isomerase/epimerase
MDKDIGYYISRSASESEGAAAEADIAEALRVFELNCKAAAGLGAKLLVLHLWGGIPSDKNIGVNIETYAELLETAGKYNLILTVENVVCSTHDPLKHMRALHTAYGNNIKFTFDVRHAEFHKILKETCEADFLWENNLVAHFHIADYNGAYMDWSKLRPVLPPGEGDIDFDYLSGFLKKTGYKGSFTLEAARAMTETGIDFEILNRRLEFVYNLNNRE